MSNISISKFTAVPDVLRALDKLEKQIATVSTSADLEMIANGAAFIHRMFKPLYKDVSDRAGEVWVSAEVKLGDELERLPKAKGTRGVMRGRDSSGGTKRAPPEKTTPTLAELGIAKKRSARAKRLNALPEKQRRKYIAELKAKDKAITPPAILQQHRAHNKTEVVRQLQEAVFSEIGPFDVVVIDPPWPMQKIDRDERPNQDAFDYPTMDEQQLAEFWPHEIADKLANDCHVFCWTTQKFVPAALRLIEAWGLNYVLLMVWHKPGGFQPIDLPQYNCEFVVYARKGVPVFVDTKDFNCCFEAPRREHSRKPVEFYELIKRVTGGSRVDVFSREQHDGFAQYGNELAKFAAE